MKKENTSYKVAKKYIQKKPMPNSLLKEFQKNCLENHLEKIYLRTAELFEDNKDSNRALQSHLGQILPCIAFYEVLIEKEGSREKALSIYEKWSLNGIDKIAKSIQTFMKLPGIYKLIPSIFDSLIDRMFGTAAGFKSTMVPNSKGFARDMVVCPYVETCNSYGYPELAQFFCKSDDICYENMHPKLVWARTKTLGRGDNCCNFRLFVKE